jgi:hypothetical protein
MGGRERTHTLMEMYQSLVERGRREGMEGGINRKRNKAGVK